MHIEDFFEDKARGGDGRYAIAYALLKLASAQESTAVHIKYLGNGNAATTMGAIEAYGMHIGEKLNTLSEALNAIADAIDRVPSNAVSE